MWVCWVFLLGGFAVCQFSENILKNSMPEFCQKSHPEYMENSRTSILDRFAAQPPRPLSGAKSQRSGLATPLCRSLFFQVRRRAAPRAQWPRDPGAPSAPHGTHPTPRDPRGPKGARGPKGGQRDPRGPKGGQGDPRGGKGTQGRLRRPWGGGPMGPSGGYSEVIRNGKPFRVEGYFEWKVIPSGWLMMKAITSGRHTKSPRAPSAPLGGGGPWGPLGVIPQLLRKANHFEWM